jgi:hypothetical protein
MVTTTNNIVVKRGGISLKNLVKGMAITPMSERQLQCVISLSLSAKQASGEGHYK